MKIEEKMIFDSHKRDNRGSEKDHSRSKVKEENAKANGIPSQLSKEECEREKAKMVV